MITYACLRSLFAYIARANHRSATRQSDRLQHCQLYPRRGEIKINLGVLGMTEMTGRDMRLFSLPTRQARAINKSAYDRTAFSVQVSQDLPRVGKRIQVEAGTLQCCERCAKHDYSIALMNPSYNRQAWSFGSCYCPIVGLLMKLLCRFPTSGVYRKVCPHSISLLLYWTCRPVSALPSLPQVLIACNSTVLNCNIKFVK
jgi:hypothetical protein